MTIFGNHVITPPDTNSAAWIRSSLGAFGTVGGCVPDGYEQYVLVRHPSTNGRDGDNAAQFVARLAELVEPHTARPDLVWYAVWDGYGWASTSKFYAMRRVGPVAWLSRVRKQREARIVERRRQEEVQRGLATVPRFDLPGRSYYLVRGALDAVSGIACPDGFGLQVPDLWWPEDRSWFVATDPDLDWNYVGGSKALVADVAAAFRDQSEAVEWTTPNSEFPQRRG